MRKILIIIVSILILAFILWKGYLSVKDRFMAKMDERLEEKIAQSIIKPTYVLKSGEELVFELPETNLLKVITYANIPQNKVNLTEEVLDEEYHYEFEYKLFGGSEKPLLEHTYHHETRISHYIDPITKEAYTSSFYFRDPLIPANSRMMMIDLRRLSGNAEEMTVKLTAKDESVFDVSFRIYYLDELPSHKMHYYWKRLSEAEKNQLASGNIYPPDLLNKSEIQNILKNNWRFLTPVGIAGQEFTRRQIYLYKDLTGEKVAEEPLPAGFYVNEDLLGVVPIPPQGGEIQFDFYPVNVDTTWTDTSLAQIHLRWKGERLGEKAFYTIPFENREIMFTHHFQGGNLVIDAPSEMVIRVYLITADGKTEITPESVYLRTYLTGNLPNALFSIQENSPVIFHINHYQNQETPFKVALRQITSKQDSTALSVTQIQYKMKRANGDLHKAGNLTVGNQLSEYDRLIGDWEDWRVTVDNLYYFKIPPKVNQIEFFSTEAPILVTGYNRPPGLTKKTFAPTDYYEYQADRTPQRIWFLIKPKNHEALLYDGRSPVLTVQDSVSFLEDRAFIAGEYQWESFIPDGDFYARTIFVPFSEDDTYRDEIVLVLYCPLPVNQEKVLNFLHPEGKNEVYPEIVYVNPSGEPFSVQIFLDGLPVYETKATGENGEIWLPTLSAGQHMITVKVDKPVQLYINYTNTGLNNALLKRSVYGFSEDRIRFDYEKVNPEESILFKWYAPVGTTENLIFHAKIEGDGSTQKGIQTDWTLMKRIYEVAPFGGSGNMVLGTDKKVDEGQLFVLPLRKDLPAGNYKITLTTENPTGYVRIGRITTGAYEERIIFKEREIGGYTDE
jgi:hypothetical protein